MTESAQRGSDLLLGPRWPRYLAVLVGGFLGTMARYGLGLLAEGGGPGLSSGEWVTAAINTLGALALGVLTGVWAQGHGPGARRPWLRAGLGPGLLGAFTTFSALALTLVHPLRPVEVLTQIAVGVAAAGLGLLLGRVWGRALGRSAEARSAHAPGAQA